MKISKQKLIQGMAFIHCPELKLRKVNHIKSRSPSKYLSKDWHTTTVLKLLNWHTATVLNISWTGIHPLFYPRTGIHPLS